MTRTEAIAIINARIEVDRIGILDGGKPVSDFDKFVFEQDEALELALKMMQDPVESLTPEELTKAYKRKEHLWDVEDIENELELSEDEYIEKFGIDESPVTQDEKEEMAHRLRKMLDRDADAAWSYCRKAAVIEVLREREETHET